VKYRWLVVFCCSLGVKGAGTVMGCDETAGEQVVKALLSLVGLGNLVAGLEGKLDSSGQRETRHVGRNDRGQRRGKREKSVGAAPVRDRLRADARSAAHNRASTDRTETDRVLEQVLDARIKEWHRTGNKVAAGNLGEQIALRVLESAGYTVTATQAELDGAVPAITGDLTSRMKAEDFVAFDRDGRYMTVNAKARMTGGGLLRDGSLAAPRISGKQRAVDYSTTRAGLVSPLDGESFGQVVAVDLISKMAQIFEIGEDGSLTRVSEPVPIFPEALDIATKYPGPGMPPPGAEDSPR
jgi:hypothetical protein